jgi:magnesium-protoporphyrin O-methyltransferase
MMGNQTYIQRRGQLQTYFDRTAADAWARLTSTAKVSRIRETVRAGRDRMRNTLLEWLPADLRGKRVLDAGCGTGALSVEAAMRGAQVVAIDLSATLVELARERLPTALGEGSIELHVGDMLDPALGSFDHVVAMDSLIHYRANDMADALQVLSARTRHSMLFTFAPRTPLLTVMHNVGMLFPHGDRAPAIEPVAESTLRKQFAGRAAMADWSVGRGQRVKSGFYTSQAMELIRR